MPKKPPKNYDLDEDQYTRSFNKADDSPKSWICRDADCAYENENMEDEECEACGEARYEELVDQYAGFKCGLVTSVEDLADKLKVCSVNIGKSEVKIVTNAANVEEGTRVVVACVGAIVQGDALKKKTVGGRASEGMLADAPMLGWTGGGAGAAAIVPEACAPGDRPPEKRPRMDGK